MALSGKLSSISANHLTPLYIVDASREALGGTIDLDPASCKRANQDIRAIAYYDELSNGLAREWRGNIFLNPPGGKVGSASTRSSAVLWWLKLAKEKQAGHVFSAVFVCFTIELLQTTQKASRTIGLSCLTDYTICVPDHRIQFDKIEDGKRVPQRSPTHCNAIVFVSDEPIRVAKFEKVFAPIGAIVKGVGR